ncbi:hypothetical protein GQ44DRAFT_828694 [Phaeosphaeriaceae sp. PMI808]|nr:hypothetical protein GQ44DRAFT_828694 [Phaeosphaeriaceae sp. PMI808]
MSTAASVHTGFWQNQQYNGIEGATITLTSTNASYLVAFLALFLGIVAGHFWAILSFVVFHIRSTLAARNGQHHQQQAILRNYHAPGAAIWQLFLATWSWRQRRGVAAIIAALPVIALALTSLMSFAAAGILSAKVTNKESDVLIKQENCGLWENPLLTRPNAPNAERAEFSAGLADDFDLASTMAFACRKDSSISSNCLSYAPKQIEWTTSTEAACPFDQKICDTNTTVRFDTGLLDTTLHFGINAPKEDRLFYRRVSECTRLKREGYVSDWKDMNNTQFAPGSVEGNVMYTWPGEEWIEFYYGPNDALGLNSTFIYSSRSPTVLMYGSQLFSLAGHNPTTPIKELNRTDANLSLLWLRLEESVQYPKPINDPWFEAKTPIVREVRISDSVVQNVTIYIADYPISVLGCVTQHQLCDPSTGSSPTCTDLGPVRNIRRAMKMLKRDQQKITLERMVNIISEAKDFTAIPIMLSGNSLLITKRPHYQNIIPPDDQWIMELDHMFGTLFQTMQIRNYRFAGGYPSSSDLQPNITKPQANATWMCGAQVVRRDDYQSLSVLGLALICSIGGLIILINLTLDSIVAWYSKRFQKGEHAIHEWEMLQAETLQEKLYKSYSVDIKEGEVSMETVLEGLRGRTYGETMGTLVERERKGEKNGALKSMSGAGTLGIGNEIEVSLRRSSTDMTSPISSISPLRKGTSA